MTLYLLRHADADTFAEADDERRLSDKGIDQARRVARFCEEQEITPSIVLSSPVRRAHETALIVSEHLRSEMITAPWLACGMNPEVATQELATFRNEASLMIVGHEPDFSSLIAYLLGVPSNSQIHVRKASLTCLEILSLRAVGARLEFSIPCRLM